MKYELKLQIDQRRGLDELKKALIPESSASLAIDQTSDHLIITIKADRLSQLRALTTSVFRYLYICSSIDEFIEINEGNYETG